MEIFIEGDGDIVMTFGEFFEELFLIFRVFLLFLGQGKDLFMKFGHDVVKIIFLYKVK